LVRARHGYHFASFVYRNHWAAYVLLLMAIALGFAFSALRRWQGGRGRLDATAAGFGLAALLALTLPMPGSRSGLLIAAGLLGIALLRLGLVLWRAWALERVSLSVRLLRTGAGLLVTGTILAGGVMLNRDTFRPHWERTQRQISGLMAGHDDLRLSLSRDTLHLAAERPVWGWGVGSYGLVFPVYQGDYLRAPSGEITTRVVHAHNDWAELAAEAGAVGLLVLLTPTALLLIRGARSGGAAGRWVLLGNGLILVYALVDFPMHCAAVLFFWTTLLCSAAPPADLRRPGREVPPTPKQA
jgi:O-antigen ligase